MPSIFTKIIEGEVPAHRIAETEDFLAFLDIRPLAKGHTLVIPKKEVDYFFNLEEEVLHGLLSFAKGVARAVEATVPCRRIGVSVVGLEVPHAHVHLIPIHTVEDMNFAKVRPSFTEEEMESLAEAIRKNYGKN